MEVMCREAGISEKKTNHSLRATALFSAGAPERLICDVTGHQSNALQLYYQLYERPSLAQKEAVSSILVQGRRSFTEEVANSDCAVSCSVAPGGKTRLPVYQVSAADAIHCTVSISLHCQYITAPAIYHLKTS